MGKHPRRPSSGALRGKNRGFRTLIDTVLRASLIRVKKTIDVTSDACYNINKKSCYTDAAYLTHTLPVSAKQLVGAKTIASCLIQFLSSITVFLSIIVYFAVIIAAVLGSDTTSYTGTLSFAMLSTEFQQSLGVTLTQYCVFLIGYSLIGCITGCCILLGCVSLGQLYTKHRILGAILAYFIVTMIMQVITYLAMLPAYGKLFAASAAGDTLPLMSFMMPAFIAILITTIILAIAMYFINIHMMTKKLNLE